MQNMFSVEAVKRTLATKHWIRVNRHRFHRLKTFPLFFRLQITSCSGQWSLWCLQVWSQNRRECTLLEILPLRLQIGCFSCIWHCKCWIRQKWPHIFANLFAAPLLTPWGCWKDINASAFLAHSFTHGWWLSAWITLSHDMTMQPVWFWSLTWILW